MSMISLHFLMVESLWPTVESLWQILVANGSALLLGAVGGGIVSALVSWRVLCSKTARGLLSDALRIQGEKEAWILEGGQNGTRLSEHPGLPTVLAPGLWLRPVEVRAVLDEARWSAPDDPFYGFIDGRRVWIVRDIVEGQIVYAGLLRSGWHPALLSSKGLEELCGWIEEVATAKHGWMLSRHGMEAISRPLLRALSTKDRREVLCRRLSPRALCFLERFAPDQNSLSNKPLDPGNPGPVSKQAAINLP